MDSIKRITDTIYVSLDKGDLIEAYNGIIEHQESYYSNLVTVVGTIAALIIGAQIYSKLRDRGLILKRTILNHMTSAKEELKQELLGEINERLNKNESELNFVKSNLYCTIADSEINNHNGCTAVSWFFAGLDLMIREKNDEQIRSVVDRILWTFNKMESELIDYDPVKKIFKIHELQDAKAVTDKIPQLLDVEKSKLQKFLANSIEVEDINLLD